MPAHGVVCGPLRVLFTVLGSSWETCSAPAACATCRHHVFSVFTIAPYTSLFSFDFALPELAVGPRSCCPLAASAS